MIVAFICAVLIIAIDQLSKFLVYGTVAKSIIGNLLWFESTLNTGVAFSMFEGNSNLFIFIAAFASGLMIIALISKTFLKSRLEKISIALILGGTLSNLIDRLIFKGVRDFIYLKFINFAIFNLADFAITIGAILFCVSIVFIRNSKEKNVKS